MHMLHRLQSCDGSKCFAVLCLMIINFDQYCIQCIIYWDSVINTQNFSVVGS